MFCLGGGGAADSIAYYLLIAINHIIALFKISLIGVSLFLGSGTSKCRRKLKTDLFENFNFPIIQLCVSGSFDDNGGFSPFFGHLLASRKRKSLARSLKQRNSIQTYAI